MILGPALSAEEAAMFESAVVPSYLSFFGALLGNLVLPSDDASVAHLGCRIGYPDVVLAEKLPQGRLVGVDPSMPALELARVRALLLPDLHATYALGQGLPTPLATGTFTHAFTLHPSVDVDGRALILAELRRLLAPGGQALIALPLRGSFPELNDMLRELAVREDLSELARSVDKAMASRPTIETIAEELEAARFADVDVDVELLAITFPSGRHFLDDSAARLLIFPELLAHLGLAEDREEMSMRYVYDAISKYWSEDEFELTVNVGCASGRRVE